MNLPHGKSKYTNEACRCEVCRTAWRNYVIKRRVERFADTAFNDGIAVGAEFHNRNTYNNYGCRCDECRADESKYRRDLTARRREARS